MSWTGAALGALMIAGCAATPIPEGNYQPEKTIETVERKDPRQNSQAEYHLELAREHLKEVAAYEAQGKEDQAKLKLIEAQVDADYALSLLREDEVLQETNELEQRISELQEEMRQTGESR